MPIEIIYVPEFAPKTFPLDADVRINKVFDYWATAKATGVFNADKMRNTYLAHNETLRLLCLKTPFNLYTMAEHPKRLFSVVEDLFWNWASKLGRDTNLDSQQWDVDCLRMWTAAFIQLKDTQPLYDLRQMIANDYHHPHNTEDSFVFLVLKHWVSSRCVPE